MSFHQPLLSLFIAAAFVAVLGLIVYRGFRLAKEKFGERDRELLTDLGDSGAKLPIDVGPNERIVYTNYSVSRSSTIWILGAVAAALTMTIILAPVGYLIGMYAYRMYRQPTFIFTDQQLYILDRGERKIYEYDRISQLQTGAAFYEMILGRGHLTFSIDQTGLEQIHGVRNHQENAQQIAAVV